MERQLNYSLARMSFVVHVMGKFVCIFEFSGCFVGRKCNEGSPVSDLYQYLTYWSLLSDQQIVELEWCFWWNWNYSRALYGGRVGEQRTKLPLAVQLGMLTYCWRGFLVFSEELPFHATVALCCRQGGKAGSVQKCNACRGRGVRIMIRQLAPGMVQQMQSVCSDCNGEGRPASAVTKCACLDPACCWNLRRSLSRTLLPLPGRLHLTLVAAWRNHFIQNSSRIYSV